MPLKPPSSHRVRQKDVRKKQNQVADRRRGSSKDRLYDTWWDRARKAHLREHPLCRYCEAGPRKRVTAATLVDHFWPHKGNVALFRDNRFWISSCAPCHSGFKQRLEHAGEKAMTKLSQLLGMPPRVPFDDPLPF